MTRRLVIALLALISLPAFCQDNTGLHGAARLRIRVLDESGAVITQAQVGFRPKIGTLPKDTATGAYGTVIISAPPGEYTVFVTNPGFTPASKEVQLSRGGTAELSFTLEQPHESVIIYTDHDSPIYSTTMSAPPQKVPVRVTVRSETGAEIPFAQVRFGGIHKTDEHGRLDLQLTPGFYDVAVTRPFFARWRKQEIQVEKEPLTLRVLLTEVAAR